MFDDYQEAVENIRLETLEVIQRDTERDYE